MKDYLKKGFYLFVMFFFLVNLSFVISLVEEGERESSCEVRKDGVCATFSNKPQDATGTLFEEEGQDPLCGQNELCWCIEPEWPNDNLNRCDYKGYECKGTKPIGEGIIYGGSLYDSGWVGATSWTYHWQQQNNCDWACDSGYSKDPDEDRCCNCDEIDICEDPGNTGKACDGCNYVDVSDTESDEDGNCGDETDNDCDGDTDNLDGDCSECSDGDEQTCGLDIGACQEGSQTCSGGFWGTCEGGITPVPEVCNDNLDNNCDGEVNEGCVNQGQPCTTFPCTCTGTSTINYAPNLINNPSFEK